LCYLYGDVTSVVYRISFSNHFFCDVILCDIRYISDSFRATRYVAFYFSTLLYFSFLIEMHCATLNNRVINAVKSSFISFEFFHVARCNISVLIHDEVQYALQNHIPVVALESTIISHGLPYPKNLTVAREIASTIRNNGAIPAMCAVVRGVPKVGLDEDDIKILAQGASSGGQDVHKLSRRDLAYACATSKNGSTTVTTTMILAHHAGIKTFATGKIDFFVTITM